MAAIFLGFDKVCHSNRGAALALPYQLPRVILLMRLVRCACAAKTNAGSTQVIITVPTLINASPVACSWFLPRSSLQASTPSSSSS